MAPDVESPVPLPGAAQPRGATDLPGAVRLRPHHPLLRRAGDAVQLGLGQSHGVEVVGLSPALLWFVRSLPRHEPAAPIDLVRSAVANGVAPDDALTLLRELYAQGALLDADLVQRLTTARRAGCVLVEGTGPLLAPVAVGLAVGGVGTLELHTSGAVSSDELGVFTTAELGLPRIEAVPEAVGRVSPRAIVHTGPSPARVDLVVFTDSLWPSPARHQALLADGVAQLVVRVSDGLGLVGPLVLPGRTACLRCLDLQHGARDPVWPSVAEDLTGRSGSADPATLAATAALAVEQALLAVESVVSAGAEPPVLDAVLELDLRRGALRRRRWNPHPECGCGAGHMSPVSNDGDGPTSAGGPPADEDQHIGGPAACRTVVDR